MSQTSLTTYTPEEIIAHARANAPFYRRLYDGLPEKSTLTDLPVIDQEEYWAAHLQDRQEVLTAPLHDGIVLNSGGTTGAPKYSYFSNEEWDSSIALSARAFGGTGLRDGDRVANLFATGNLYASFIFATESMKWTEARVMQLPLGFSPVLGPAASIIHAFKANVLAGFPTHLLRIIDFMDQEKLTGVQVERIIYGGELFTPDQQRFLQSRFPGVQVCSAGYASVDAGLIGYADTGCAAGEHRLFDGATLIEILDEQTGQPIDEPGKPGRIVFTSLIRRLMPLLRYPSGDRAQWVEAAGVADRKFLLLGRSEEAARIARYTLEVTEAAALLAPFRETLGIEQFQLLVVRENLLDGLIFRVAATAPPETLAGKTGEILDAFARQRPDILEPARAGIMHLPRIEWVRADELIISPRTGKMLRVVDRRDG